jgi:hypothetical protein
MSRLQLLAPRICGTCRCGLTLLGREGSAALVKCRPGPPTAGRRTGLSVVRRRAVGGDTSGHVWTNSTVGSLGSDSETEEARGPGTIFGEVVRLLRGRRVMAAKWVPASRCAPPLSFGVGSSGPPNVLVRGSVWLNDVSNGYLAWALSEFAGTTGTIVSRNRHADQPFYSQVSGS